MQIELRDEVWVEPSFSASAHGPQPWLDAVGAAIDRYLSVSSPLAAQGVSGGHGAGAEAAAHVGDGAGDAEHHALGQGDSPLAPRQ